MDLYAWSFNAIRIERQHIARHDRMAKFYWKLLDDRCVDCPYKQKYMLAVNMRHAARERLKYARWVNDRRGMVKTDNPVPIKPGPCPSFFVSGTFSSTFRR